MTWENGWCDECDCPIGVGSCDGCCAVACIDADEGPAPESVCPHCGKEYEDFSDMGCGHCDQRHLDFGALD